MINYIEISMCLLSEKVVASRIELSDNDIKLSVTELDFPKNLTGAKASLCTDPRLIKIVKIDRDSLTKRISSALTQHVMDQLTSKDTINGYLMEETEND